MPNSERGPEGAPILRPRACPPARGRPRKRIDLGRVADAGLQILAESGYEAVSVEAVAERLSLSRATLYRRISTRDELLTLMFDRGTQQLEVGAAALLAEGREPSEELPTLVRLHVGSAVDRRRGMAVFFGGAELPPVVLSRWHAFNRRYEKLWRGAVRRAMDAGVLPPGDPVLTTRLLLGMVIWVARWDRQGAAYTTEEIVVATLDLVGQRAPLR
ncbi:TetR/AcrR family transcriptional regulator [Actinacidiphila rubida]|uniref:Transcriptional regulator, TetR family n=1 Tax=Actinacidiphila rubida TaxID=310780 RepID=A0A1H8RIL5_9ACTN|nr:TetR/AcrR family transcriptional regulator [Actinacidiphila rubida]SEO66162.1 transcriptional regulator, TetR family [Actinacidiphila rubida]